MKSPAEHFIPGLSIFADNLRTEFPRPEGTRQHHCHKFSQCARVRVYVNVRLVEHDDRSGV